MDVVAAARRLAADGLVLGTAGNVSARAGDDLVEVSATGAVLAELDAATVCTVRLDGTLVAGGYPPTSELGMHLSVYRELPAAGAVVHAHASAATAAACVLDAPGELPVLHYQMLELGGAVPVVPYRLFGSAELAGAVVDALGGGERSAVLLSNHGALTVGTTPAEAVARMALLEWLCGLWLTARAAGTPRVLDAAQVAEVAAEIARRGYGRLQR